MGRFTIIDHLQDYMFTLLMFSFIIVLSDQTHCFRVVVALYQHTGYEAAIFVWYGCGDGGLSSTS